MKSKSTLWVMMLILSGLALAFGGYFAGMRHTGSAAAAPNADPGKIDPKTGRKELYWHAPMVPGQKFDKPGKPPFMDMQLVPVKADEAAAEDGVMISPTLQQNLGIRYATVRREEGRDSFELVGTTQFDESDAEVIQSRVTGYIDHLYARAPLLWFLFGVFLVFLFVF